MNSRYKIIFRSLLIIGGSVLLTSFFSNYFTQSTMHITVFDQEKNLEYHTFPVPMDVKLKELPLVAKAPLPLMRFDAYAINNVSSSTLNIDFMGSYKEIPSGESRLLKEDFYLPSSLTFERSIVYKGDKPENPSGEFKFFIKPTSITKVWVWLFYVLPILWVIHKITKPKL